jgi:dethiobiotin synthetase
VQLINAAGVDEDINFVNPYRLSKPLAPSVAAEFEGVRIDKRKIISSYKSLSGKYEVVIVEGAGGIMVPIFNKYLTLDLINDLGLPVIIVARPGLGTVNHTLMTIAAARSRDIDVLGVVINYSVKTKKGTAEKTNPELIEKVGGVPVLGNVKYLDGNDRVLDGEIRTIAGTILKYLK